MGAIKQLVGQTAIYGLGNMFVRLIGYLLTPWLTRICSVEEYGIYTDLIANIIFLQVLLTYGLETGYFKFASKGKNKLVFTNIFSNLFTTTVLFIVAGFIFSDSLLHYFGEGYNKNLIYYFILINGIDAVCVIPLAEIRLKGKPKKYSIIRIIEIIVFVFFVYLFTSIQLGKFDFTIHLKFENIVNAIFLANVISSTVKFIALSGEIRSNLIKQFDFKLIKRIIWFSLPLMVSQLAGTMNEVLDRFMLKKLLDKDLALYSVGIYGANLKLAVIVNIFIQMFRYGAEPFFFKIYDRKDSKNTFSKLLNLFTAFLLLTSGGIIIGLDIFKHLIGEEFRCGLDIVPYLLFGYIFYGILYNMSVWYKGSGLTKYAILITATGLVINVIIDVWLIPAYTYKGAAIGRLSSYFIMVIFSYLLSQKVNPMNYNTRRILVYTMMGLAIVLSYYVIEGITLKYVISVGIWLVFAYFVIIKEKLYENFKQWRSK